MAFTVVRTIGAAYLVHLGVQAIRHPKMVTIAFLPQFINPDLGQVWLHFAILIALEFLVDGAFGVPAGRIGGWLHHRHAVRRRIDVATGCVFTGLGVRLAAER